MDEHEHRRQCLPLPPIPDGVQSLELLSVWLVGRKPTFVLTQNLWDDPGKWGLLLADVIQHLGNAYERVGKEREQVVLRIKDVFDAEWDRPTSGADPV